MKRWFAIGFMGTYLSVLLFGLGCHTLNFRVASHPAMYYIVWDMFCGWATYASRAHILGEGESGKFYELAPGPWGGFKPWGDMDRANYDVYGRYCGRIALNTLRHTQHEPIARILVVEETWSKKFDLPPAVWSLRFDEPQRKKTYCRVLAELTGDGQTLRTYLPWLAYQELVSISSNPRLQAEAQRYRPLLLVDAPDESRGRDLTLPASADGLALGSPVGTTARMLGGLGGVWDGN